MTHLVCKKHLSLTLLCIISFLAVTIVEAQDYASSSDLRVSNLIYGTLLTPETPTKRLAIIIPGSGPTDRDGNQQMMRNNSLKLLAESLRDRGIASFRYDKRILALLKMNALQEEELNFDLFVDDAVAVVNYFKKQGRFDHITIIGHSQGSLVGMLAAQKTAIDAFISLSGPGQSIDQTIINQIGLQMPDLKEKAIEAFQALKSDGNVTSYSPALSSIFRPSVQPFMASWMQYDPKKEIGNLDIPVMIIDGTSDLQVSQEEAELLLIGNPKATHKTIENMNHVLRIIQGDALENSKSYNLPQLPISNEVSEVIVEFIKGN